MRLQANLWLRLAIQGFLTLITAFFLSILLSASIVQRNAAENFLGLVHLSLQGLEAGVARGELESAHASTQRALQQPFSMVVIDLYRPDGTPFSSPIASEPLELSAHERARLSFEPTALGTSHERTCFVSRLSDGTIVAYRFRFQNPVTTVSPVIIGMVMTTVLTLVIASVLIARDVALPLRAMARAVKSFAEGNVSARVGLIRHDELGVLARAFDDLADQIIASRTAERELLANISHELRTPLARIAAMLELASAKQSPESASRCFREVTHDIEDLTQLVDDLLTNARADIIEGRLIYDGDVDRHRVSLREVVQSTVERFRHRYPERVVDLTIEGDLTVEGDRFLLSNAFLNLLDNARKYGPTGEAITVIAQASQGGYEIVVSDRGPGIPTERLSELFRPFFRGDPSRDRRTGGVGLGLHLARRVMGIHGGRLTYVPGTHGATFRAHFAGDGATTSRPPTTPRP